MAWYIVYKGRTITGRGKLKDNLDKAQIEYYIPLQHTEYLDGDEIKTKEQEVLKNLIFIKTESKIESVIKDIDGLRSPYIDLATGKPSIVSDAEMYRFIEIVRMKNLQARILQDPFQRFSKCQKVRVIAGDFKGTEGYVLRIRGDRKLIISLGDMAVAISGIHHTLLEPID